MAAEERRRTKYVQNFGERDVRIGGLEKITRARRAGKNTAADNDRTGFTIGEVFLVTGVGKKCDLSGSRIVDRSRVMNNNAAVADDSATDIVGQFIEGFAGAHYFFARLLYVSMTLAVMSMP